MLSVNLVAKLKPLISTMMFNSHVIDNVGSWAHLGHIVT